MKWREDTVRCSGLSSFTWDTYTCEYKEFKGEFVSLINRYFNFAIDHYILLHSSREYEHNLDYSIIYKLQKHQ